MLRPSRPADPNTRRHSSRPRIIRCVLVDDLFLGEDVTDSRMPVDAQDDRDPRVSRDGLASIFSPVLALDGSHVVAGRRFSEPANPTTGTDGLIRTQRFVRPSPRRGHALERDAVILLGLRGRGRRHLGRSRWRGRGRFASDLGSRACKSPFSTRSRRPGRGRGHRWPLGFVDGHGVAVREASAFGVGERHSHASVDHVVSRAPGVGDRGWMRSWAW